MLSSLPLPSAIAAAVSTDIAAGAAAAAFAAAKRGGGGNNFFKGAADSHIRSVAGDIGAAKVTSRDAKRAVPRDLAIVRNAR